MIVTDADGTDQDDGGEIMNVLLFSGWPTYAPHDKCSPAARSLKSIQGRVPRNFQLIGFLWPTGPNSNKTQSISVARQPTDS